MTGALLCGQRAVIGNLMTLAYGDTSPVPELVPSAADQSYGPEQCSCEGDILTGGKTLLVFGLTGAPERKFFRSTEGFQPGSTNRFCGK